MHNSEMCSSMLARKHTHIHTEAFYTVYFYTHTHVMCSYTSHDNLSLLNFRQSNKTT